VLKAGKGRKPEARDQARPILSLRAGLRERSSGAIIRMIWSSVELKVGRVSLSYLETG